jgi:TPR repeat protein
MIALLVGVARTGRANALTLATSPVAADGIIDLDKYTTLTDIYQLEVDGKFAEAVARLTPLADKGNAEAEYALGRLMAEGKGVPADPAGALKLYVRSAVAGYPFAQREVGLLEFSAGRYDKARDILLALAQEGFRGKVSAALSKMYAKGLGVPQDQAKADCWARKTWEPLETSIKSGC